MEIFKNFRNGNITFKQREKELKDNINNVPITNSLKNNQHVLNIENEVKIKEKKENEENKKYYKTRNIFNEIIEEVKDEKSYIHKVVHRKLIEGARELKKYNSLNKYNNRYSTISLKDLSLKTSDSQNSDFFKFENRNTEKNYSNFNIRSTLLLSEKKEVQKQNYFNINNRNSEFQPKHMNTDYDNFNNIYKSNDNIFEDSKSKTNENHGVKIKKIKLDKLKNKLKGNNLHLYNGDNININLSLNNKIININNSQKIYAPKKGILANRSSIKNISLSSSLNPYVKISSLSQNFYSKSPQKNNSEIFENIKPFSATSTFEVETNKSNDMSKISKIANKYINNINSSTYNNINNKTNKNRNKFNTIRISTDYNNIEKIKSILYSKAKIQNRTDTECNRDLTTYRSQTLKYIKKINETKNNDNIKKENLDKNKIIKTQEMHIKGFTENLSNINLNHFEKEKQINFNLKSSLMKSIDSINDNKYRILTNGMLNVKLNNYKNINFSKKNQNIQDNKNSIKKSKEKILKARDCYNISNEDISYKNNEISLKDIINMLNLEDLLIIEDKFNLILIILGKGNKKYEEYFDFLNYFFSSSLRTSIEQIFEYYPKQIELMKAFINYSLIFIIICYDFVINSIIADVDNSFSLNEIAHLIYINILIVINTIKSKIISDNKDNYSIRLIELSKIEKTINNKLSYIDNDFSFSKRIMLNNANFLISKISSIIEKNKLNKNLSLKYNCEIFTKLKTASFKEISNFFQEKILKEDFVGCSVLACTYLKSKPDFTPLVEPFLHFPNKKNYTLVLDLDETLIHFKVKHSGDGEGMLRLRPGVFSFLEKIREFYEIILFTEASEAYANLMIEAFNKNKKYFDYKLYRQHTIIIENDFVKDLSKLGRPIDKIIIIDNIQQNFKLQKNNGIVIKPFLGEDKKDKALEDLIPILINIAKDEIDVRNGLVKYRDEILTKISSNLFRRNKHK